MWFLHKWGKGKQVHKRNRFFMPTDGHRHKIRKVRNIRLSDGKHYIMWRRINQHCKELGFSQHVGKGDYIPESLFYLLGMKANNETALKYQRYDK